jgi:DtxR family transcriptional regulator, Mn-dependent transcriptional regulator
MNSLSEENYLKAVYKLSDENHLQVYTTDLAKKMGTSSASVTDMLQKLGRKKLIIYKKYQGVKLTEQGKKAALNIIRKHRLWEMFLAEKLKFGWDEVHAVAEQLEHISSDKLIERLDEFLGYPAADPHGDPIPDSNGKVPAQHSVLLSSISKGDKAVISGVVDHHPSFLKYLESIGLNVGTAVKVETIAEYDRSMNIVCGTKKSVTHISNDIAKNLLVIKK